jgi:HSP20 family molecular chaperone IbpA
MRAKGVKTMLFFENEFRDSGYRFDEDKTSWRVDVDLPGHSELNVSIRDQYLVVESKRNTRPFKRMFTVPRSVMTDDVSASYTDGVLSVRLPKKEPRTIPISIEKRLESVAG